MELVFVVLGSLFVLWGVGALWAAWRRPDLVAHPMFSRTLLLGKIAPRRGARTLAASQPILFGLLMILTSLPQRAALWPYLVVLGIAFATSIAFHLQHSDG